MRSGGDKVIISKKGAIWVYFSVTDDADNGTIVNFIERRTDKTIGEIGQELGSWLGGSVDLPETRDYVPDVAEQEFDPKRVQRIFYYCRLVHKHAYLEGRGITEGVLSSERFTGRIYQDRYHNAVFPHYNEKGVCGLELKNTEMAVFTRGSERTLWRSNIKKEDITLIISESVIDALSYHQLFSPLKAGYVATGGALSPEQGVIIREFVMGFKALKNIILITYNDKGGDNLTAKLETVIEESGFEGEVIRRSPDPRGCDWNNILNPNL